MNFSQEKVLIVHKAAQEMRVGVQMELRCGSTRVLKLVEGGLAVRADCNKMHSFRARLSDAPLLRRRSLACKLVTSSPR